MIGFLITNETMMIEFAVMFTSSHTRSTIVSLGSGTNSVVEGVWPSQQKRLEFRLKSLVNVSSGGMSVAPVSDPIWNSLGSSLDMGSLMVNVIVIVFGVPTNGLLCPMTFVLGHGSQIVEEEEDEEEEPVRNESEIYLRVFLKCMQQKTKEMKKKKEKRYGENSSSSSNWLDWIGRLELDWLELDWLVGGLELEGWSSFVVGFRI